MMKSKRIGWIGTGLMGNPMVKHLLNAGYKVNVHNRTKSKAQNLIDMGATWMDSAADIAQSSDIIVTIIGYPKDVDEVYFGDNGVLKNTRPNSILIDMTTTSPSLAEAINKQAEKISAHFIDAPVSGGEVGAINGTLSIMIGGEKTMVDQVLPLFEVFGKNMIYQGAASTGQHTKMCNQITIAGTMIGVCESLIYGKKAGLNLDTMLESISKGAAGCWTLDVLAPKVVNNDFEPGFMVEHFIKDLGIALNEAENMKLSLPGLALAKQLYLSVLANGGAQKGTQALYLTLEEMSGMKNY